MISGEARADGLSGECLQLSQLPRHWLRLAPRTLLTHQPSGKEDATFAWVDRW